MMKAAYNPHGCFFFQIRLAMDSALDLVHAEMMGWPPEERPTRIHALEPKGQGMRVHFSTATDELAERAVDAYTPVVWHELALVRDRRSDYLHHRPLVRALNARLREAPSGKA